MRPDGGWRAASGRSPKDSRTRSGRGSPRATWQDVAAATGPVDQRVPLLRSRTPMRELTDRALDTAAQLGATYADVRVVRRRDESINVKSGRVEGVAMGETDGFGVRVLVDGAWGFAASDTPGARRGRSRRRPGGPDRQGVGDRAPAPRRARRSTARDPGRTRRPSRRTRSRSRSSARSSDLLEADRAAGAVKGVTFTESMYSAHREWKTFAATDGSFTEQVITQVGAAVEANAIEGDEHQRRSYPDAGGGYQAAGYEYVRGLDLAGNGRVGRRGGGRAALMRRSVRRARARSSSIPSMLYLQIHESCGHPTELDRVFGTEASYAGTSFLTPDKLEEGFQYGSELVTIVADATAPGGLGTFGWDDEGVAAQACRSSRTAASWATSPRRETAPRVGRQSGGAMRADGWNRIPLIRMTNVNMLPVPGMSLDEIVADTDDGLYLANNRSWSIDDRRLNFQFATEVAYEIKGGKKGQLYKNATYTGITYEFWRSCDAVGDDRSYVMLGTPNCGKGEPSQTARVGHAVPGARFRDVQVGVGKW